MKVSEIGEFGLIEKLTEMLDSAQKGSRPELLIGIGDDTTAWQDGTEIQLATIDSLVEGVHFNLDATSWEDLGWKAAAIGLSDIAAMGGQASCLLVSLALPDDTEMDDVRSLYTGMIDLAGQHRVAIAGGNVSRAPLIVINIATTGSAVTADKILRRSGAKPEDKIAVSGHPGTAAAGLEMLTKGIPFDADTKSVLSSAFLRPQPRLALGQLLIKHGATAAIDLSDGLLADLGHLCRASQTAARLEVGRLPVHPIVRTSYYNRATELALSGGEDYELLFTAVGQAVERIAAEAGLPITVIGEIAGDGAGEINLVGQDGSAYKSRRAGWEHFVSH
jgi:thiamine-monophosphate kinase